MSAAPLRHQAQKLAALLPPLLLEAERVASIVHQGTHGRRRAGQGESFWQFRRYASGDDARQIDWRQSARSDKLFIREREWEAAQSAYLWADHSGSMHYASSKNVPAKAERARLLMLALASLLLRGGEKVIWLNETPVFALGKNGLERIAARIDPAEKGESLPPPVRFARFSHMVLCSDFLMPEEDFLAFMHGYAAHNIRGVLMHILDPAEDVWPFEGRLELLGCENEPSLLLPNAGALGEAYRKRMQEHKEGLMRAAESAGWFYLRHVTSVPPHLALLQLYQRLTADRDR
jgi:uncharacterized protein (DUF58 family)